MHLEKFYRVLCAVIMPITFLLAFFTLPFLLVVLTNPSALFGLFVFVCVLIYTFKSVLFFRRNILPSVPAKAKTRDWIRINGFISLFFVLEIFASAYMVFAKPVEVMKVIDQMMVSVAGKPGAENITSLTMYHAFKNIMIFFSVYGLLLAVHIFISFKLLKKYRSLLAE